jgi:hypothetical protein
MPGTWEVRLSDLADVSSFDAMQAERDEPVKPTRATVTVSALGADVASPRAADSDGPAADGHVVSVTNRMATFKGGIAGLPLGSARREQPTIRNGEQRQYEVDVPAGSTSLMVRVSGVSDPAADLDVYVFDCSGKECRRSGQTDSDPHGDEIVTIANPAAGKWKVVVDGASVPSGGTTFRYLDVVFNPSYGAVNTSDVPDERKTGAKWTAAAQTWLANPLPAGREPFAAVRLQGTLSGGSTFGIGILELGSLPGATGTGQR